MHRLQKLPLADLTAWGMIALYIAYFFNLALLRHISFNSSGFDLGIYDQVTWNTFQGRFLFYTTTGIPASHLSNHASPIMWLVAPFYLIHTGPETLLFVQTLAVGLGGLPLFWLGRDKLGPIAGLSLLSAYLLFPTLQVINIWDFHPPVLAVAFLMFAFYSLETNRPLWFLLMCLLTLLSKENLPLVVAFLGGYAIVRHRRWMLGSGVIIAALAYFFMIMTIVIPAHSVTSEHIFIGYYEDLGNSPAEIVITAVTRPDLVLKNLWQPAKLEYLRDIFVPFGLLSLFGLPVLLIGTPLFAINILSANQAMHDASGGQYGADVAPWLALSALYGLVFLRDLTPTRHQKNVVRGVSGLLLVVALGWQVQHGFTPLALDPPTWQVTQHDQLAHRFLDQIPPDAPISAQGKLYPHLSNRLIAYQLPDVHEAEYVFVDVTRNTWPIHPADLRTRVEELLYQDGFGVRDGADGYLLLQRGLPEATYPDPFYDFACVETATPEYPLDVTFEDTIRLLGFDLLDDPRRQESAVRLYWQPLREINRDLRLYPFFLNAQGQIIETTDLRPMLTQLWYPPRKWHPGEIVISETLPWPLGEQWTLGVGILAGDAWADWSQRLKVTAIKSETPLRQFEANTWVRLASFRRDGRQLQPITPPDPDLTPTHAVTANLSQQIKLRGYDLRQAGHTLDVTLHWQALTNIPLDYSIFVHLIDQNGQMVAQHDGTPFWQLPIPTSTWQSGEKIQDQHPIDLPEGLAGGTYRLHVGVYYWETLERLEMLDKAGNPMQNYVDLGEITVE